MASFTYQMGLTQPLRTQCTSRKQLLSLNFSKYDIRPQQVLNVNEDPFNFFIEVRAYIQRSTPCQDLVTLCKISAMPTSDDQQILPLL